MRIWKDVWRRIRIAAILWLCALVLEGIVFRLYCLPREPLLYSALLTAFLFLVFIGAEYRKEQKRSAEREQALAAPESAWKDLPEAGTSAEADYQKVITELGTRLNGLTEEFRAGRQDSLDYFSVWVHQIKTPIAVMKLKLSADTPENRALSAELFRIEQYVEMVLQYIRLGSGNNDLVIREVDLDEVIRECVRKFAPLFVEKKLKLEYVATGKTVVTDRKWFACILEQLLSNAVKYTPSGSIAITEEAGILTVADTGIGIAPEDLPRIFEKGYTGNNGRLGQKSSGLGLYLVRKAADMLSISIRAESTPGKGSRFSLDLRQPE